MRLGLKRAKLLHPIMMNLMNPRQRQRNIFPSSELKNSKITPLKITVITLVALELEQIAGKVECDEHSHLNNVRSYHLGIKLVSAILLTGMNSLIRDLKHLNRQTN